MSVIPDPRGGYRARHRGPDGQRERHFRLKRDAERWYAEQQAAKLGGLYVDPRAGRITFREVAESWRMAAPHGPATRYRVQRDLGRYVYPTLGSRPIGAIRHTELQGWILALSVAPSTAAVTLSYVKSVFRAAIRDRIITADPSQLVKSPPKRPGELWIPTLGQVDTLRANLPPRFRAVVDLAIGSGMRQGEVFGLDITRVDFLRRFVDVHRQLVTLPGATYVDVPKTSSSWRTVPLAQLTLDWLARHLAEHSAPAVLVTDRTDPHLPVERPMRLMFTSEAGMSITRRRWSHVWSVAARAAGFPPRAGLHSLRHLYASLLFAGGESVKAVQVRLGHSDPATTLRVYAHLIGDSDERTRDVITAALDPSVGRARAEK